MRVVLDTNVVVSGLLSPFGPPGEIMRMVSSGVITLCIDARILTEYVEVLARPKLGFNQEAVKALLDFIEVTGQTVASTPLPRSLPDSDDNPILEIALAGKASYLVTSSLKDYHKDWCFGMAVVSPAEFVVAYRKGLAT